MDAQGYNSRCGDCDHSWVPCSVVADWSFERPVEGSFRSELSNISEQDLIIIETFLHRRLDLDPMVRFNTAAQLSDLVQRKCGFAKPPDQSDEDFLQSVARQVRDHARLRI